MIRKVGNGEPNDDSPVDAGHEAHDTAGEIEPNYGSPHSTIDEPDHGDSGIDPNDGSPVNASDELLEDTGEIQPYGEQSAAAAATTPAAAQTTAACMRPTALGDGHRHGAQDVGPPSRLSFKSPSTTCSTSTPVKTSTPVVAFADGMLVEYDSPSWGAWLEAEVGHVWQTGELELISDDGSIMQRYADPMRVRRL